MEKKCAKCNNFISWTDNFCKSCGNELDKGAWRIMSKHDTFYYANNLAQHNRMYK